MKLARITTAAIAPCPSLVSPPPMPVLLVPVAMVPTAAEVMVGGGGYGSYQEGAGYVPSGGHFHGRAHCAPVYRTHTVEVSRYTQCRTPTITAGAPSPTT